MHSCDLFSAIRNISNRSDFRPVELIGKSIPEVLAKRRLAFPKQPWLQRALQGEQVKFSRKTGGIF